MFDSTPPNLPVEPAPKPVMPGPAPAPSSGPAGAPIAGMPVVKGKKEPEDIFAGLQLGGEEPTNAAMPSRAGSPSRTSPVMILAIVVVSLLILGGIGFGVWMFVIKPKAEVPAEIPAVQQPAAPAPSAPVTTPPQNVSVPITPESPATTEPAAATATAPEPTTAPAAIPVPTVAPTEGVDTDADGLTDVEEGIYGTTPTIVDTDGDGFSDGSEIKNLFSPTAKGKPLSADPHVQKAAWNGWSLLLPTAWILTPSADDPSSATIRTGTASTFVLHVMANPSHRTLQDIVGVPASEKVSKTASGYYALQTPDGLTTYLAAGDTIVSMTYALGTDRTYEYRTSAALLVNSFALNK